MSCKTRNEELEDKIEKFKELYNQKYKYPPEEF